MKSLSTLSVCFVVMSLLPLSAQNLFARAAVVNPFSAARFSMRPILAAASAQQDIAGFGPLDPTPPTGMTPQQIIDKFAARESAFNLARQNYTFRQSVKVDTISEDTGKPDGEYQQVTDILFDKNGRREERVVFAPQNTLERVMMSPADFADIEHRLPFVLTTEDLPDYDITYLGRQRVDELDTYVFQAGPKVIVKNHRYFQGKVWVDQQDFQIVLINGKSVPDDKRRGHEDLSPPFTTYYEQVDGKYWFPTYTKAEGNLHFSGGQGYMSQDVQLRTIVKYTDYKQFRATSKIIYNGEELPPADTTPQPANPPAPPK